MMSEPLPTGHTFWSLYYDGYNHFLISLLSCTAEFLGERYYITFAYR